MTACSGQSWRIPAVNDAAVMMLAEEASVPPLVARLLWDRGCRSAEAAARFLSPAFDQLHNPSLLCGIDTAVERIVHAIRGSEPILIYGDYDVDGTLATVLLKTAIDRISPKGVPSLVRYHIPHRIREGYGLQASVLAAAAAEGVKLVISVDTGIRAFAAADEAKALGLDLIVTDHHLPEAKGVPNAVAVINPNQPGCRYPEKSLCGAAVAWKLAEALLHAAQQDPSGLHPVDAAGFQKLQRSLLKLVAIATVADAVPLVGENRAIVALGLGELGEVHQPGLRALMRLAKVGGNGRAPLASEVAFRLAPRINAAGRMDVATDVVQLMLSRDIAEAETLAMKLHTLNDERRVVEAEVLLELQQQIDLLVADAEASAPGVFVLDGHAWHRGVIGILASRVVERTKRPALVIAHHEGEAHGSGRSVEGFHLLEALTAVHARHTAEQDEELFIRFGGHAHAVGFSLPSGRVGSLRRRMLAHAAEQAHAKQEVVLGADAELPLQQVNRDLWTWLCRLQPFGNGNEEPVFVARNVRVVDMRVLKERHLKLCVQPADGPTVECLCWARSFDWPQRAAECGITSGTSVDLLYQLRWNERAEPGCLEIHVCDVRSCI